MCYIVAEIASNHDGNLGQAFLLIDEAVRAEANAVKFQCEPMLPREWLSHLVAYANGRGIDCFATAFDPDAVAELVELGVPFIKIASPEIIYSDLIAAALGSGVPLLISTGMANWDEIERVVAHDYPASAASRVTLLQCTSQYPTPPDRVNLRAMVAMRERWGGSVGLSDHTMSTTIPAAAVALGATVIEKHFTLEPERCANVDGPDHAFALQPTEFRRMVSGIREVEQALGNDRKDGPMEGEMVETRGRRLRWRRHERDEVNGD